MKNIVLSLVGLLMFVGCGQIMSPYDPCNSHWLTDEVDNSAEELWVCEDWEQFPRDPDEISMPSSNLYYYTEDDCYSVGCNCCYGGWDSSVWKDD